MTGIVFKDTLQQNWRQMLYWGLGMAILGWFMTIVAKDSATLKGYADLFASMPPALMAAIGIQDAAAMATPAGFLNFVFFGYAILVYAVYCVLAGLNVTANEEDDGIMDVVLSLPLPRWRIVLEKSIAFMLILAGIVAVGFVGIWIGQQSYGIELDMGLVAESSLNALPAGIFMLALTVFLAAIIRRKSTATAVAATIIIASYFMNAVSESASGTLADIMRTTSFFTYYDNASVMTEGLNASNIALLLGLTVVLVAGSIWAFNRRDVGL